MLKSSTKHRLAFCICVVVFVGLASETASVRGDDKDSAVDASTAIRPEALRADMRFLADDLLEGRATGARGHEIAAKFIASQFEAMGLGPAGEGGTYFQSVPLRSIRLDEEHCTLTLARAGKKSALIFGTDFIPLADPERSQTSIEGPVVYVGFGVTAPERGYDDYAGIDAKGKIVAVSFGAPPNLEPTMRAHYSSAAVKSANAVAHGAVGAIILNSSVDERRYSFPERARDLAFPDMRWLDAKRQPNDYSPQLRGGVILSLKATALVAETAGKSPDEIYAAGVDAKPSSISLSLTAKIEITSRFEDLRSPNVAAQLTGSDPKLRNEYVVYTAHLDHLGIGEPVNGDKIYNGALDNASGSACLLEIARAYSRITPRPRRSILFVSVTGEEEGLLGSDYFARYPTVAKDRLVANINIDGNLALLWPIKDIIARGAEHSTLSEPVREAAARLNLDVTPDPFPELVFFIRSDQYSFVKQGIPAVFLGVGVNSSDPKIKPQEIITKWRQTVYHKPQDDMNQPFDFESGARYARYAFLLGYLVAQRTERPAWNPGDFFGQHYGRRND